MDDPEISPEAQQVIDRLRTLLSQLEKDLEEIRFKASYFELPRLHSEKHLSRNELCLLTLKTSTSGEWATKPVLKPTRSVPKPCKSYNV